MKKAESGRRYYTVHQSLPNSLPILIRYYLISRSVPFGVSATSKTFNNILLLQVFQYPADHINANARTLPLYISNTEITGKT
jgi:hypothetical protein